MKLIRHGASGCEKPGAIDSQGQARDLSDLVPDFTPEWMAPGRLAALRWKSPPSLFSLRAYLPAFGVL